MAPTACCDAATLRPRSPVYPTIAVLRSYSSAAGDTQFRCGSLCGRNPRLALVCVSKPRWTALAARVWHGADAMPFSGSHALRALPDWSAVPSNSEEDRVLVNRRVAYFGAVLFVLSFSFYAYNAILCGILGGVWPPLGSSGFVLHAAATAVCGLQWLLCRGARRSSKQLNVVDVGGTLSTMFFFAWMAVEEVKAFDHSIAVDSGRAEVLLMSLITLAVVITRAIIVPGTVLRTLWLSTAASAYAPVAAFLIARTSFEPQLLARSPWLTLTTTAYAGMWSLLTIAVATIASRVIYGLQQRVRNATQVGQYTLAEKIGEGGMGVVYRAHHALLRRPTAVKLLPLERAGTSNVVRFEREVQLTSSLTHPNTIAIFDFGHTPDGVFYYAMEYLEGITLEDLVAYDGPQAPGRVVQILKQVAGALVEAHAIGLIHRDIKPANLMLCVRGLLPDQVKVLDFGLVKEHRAGETMLQSSTGTLLGTPHYLAPETILDPGNIDARVDLYALGAVGYRLLVGNHVFSGHSLVEICAQHLHTKPVPPSLRAGREFPSTLEALVLRCLEKEPSRRFASAKELLAALKAAEAQTGDEAWNEQLAQSWWDERGRSAIAWSRSQKAAVSESGPRTVAIDMHRREVSVA
jgi:serine/threonine-protein kinase